MNTIWLDEPPMYECQKSAITADIKSWRRTEFADYQIIRKLTRMKTFDMFGDVDPIMISENSCLSIVQINEFDEVVTNISLCNYPNVPSLPVNGWVDWISRHYGIHGITERNTLFVHMLLWDVRYNEKFYKRMLDAVFISNIHTVNVIFIMPPWVTPVGFIEENMTRIVPNGETDSYRVQALYISLRHMHCPRLKIRRVVEEDNDDIIPILNKESERFKELYGEFYISEMMRYPDGIRHMVVAEADGLASGILCINKIIDVQSLDEHFELAPYHGLVKENHLRDKKTSSYNYTRFNSDILFPDEELETKENHSKVKPVYKISKFRSTDDIDEHFSDDEDTRTEIECSSSYDGDICQKFVNSDTITSENSTVKISGDFYTKIDTIQGSRTSFKSESTDKTIYTNAYTKVITGSRNVSISNEKAKSISKLEIGIVDEDEKFDETVSSSNSDKSSDRSFVRVSENLISGSKREEDFSDEEFRTIDVPVEVNPRKIIHKDIKLPIYNGETNAFTLELFSMREDVDERLSYDYLEAVFECFPDEEYCVVLIPPSFPTFSFLQNFVRVPLRFNKDYPLVMYLAHRATIVGVLKTREANFSDISVAEELLSDIPKGNQILTDFEYSFECGSPYTAYTFFCEETLVGFAILCVENEIEFIRNQYRIDDFMSFDNMPIESHARIIHLIIMPIFASLHRYFFQELMNLSDKYALYYRLYQKDASAMTRGEPLVTFLGEMIPVLPRRNLINYTENIPGDLLIQNTNNFALYMMVPRVASTQKIDVNLRIVVVGASDCGLSVLETLVFGPNASFVNFTNITLISPNGIPFENRPDDLEKDQLKFSGRYSRDYRHLVGTRSWINVVQGTLTAIDRKDKFVTVSSMGSIYYDYLVITCGLQYGRPKFVEQLKAERRGDLRDYPNPENCLTINTERDAADCLRCCKNLIDHNPSCSVVFYGKNIDSYSALGILVESGFPSENITLLEPALKICEPEHTTFFGNCEVEAAVIKATKESGVKFLSDWDLVDWILEEDNEEFFIRNLIIERKGNRRELACDIFFNFKEKTMNMDTFLAICRSGLVFDGSLVINPEFRTNDPSIFAAGTITKYSRRFYADEFSHKYHNPYEVGERLAQKLRNIIDPKNSEDDFFSSAKSKLDITLPVFKKPIITSCKLPGGYFYLNVKKSGKLINEDTNDVVLITGFPESNIGYFRLHLNQFDTVETITCLSRKVFEIENYISLYGKHQTLLNDLKIRFQKSMVPDLYSYFREPWAVAIFLDRFDCLRVENRATLLSSTVVCGDSLIRDCTKALIKSKWEAIKPEDRELIETRYAGSVYQEELENCLIDFLQYSENQLPMYCNPRFLRRFLNDVQSIQDQD